MEFYRVKEDKDNFIQKVLKVCKVFKVKPLKTRKTKKELQGVPASKASAIISKEWKKVKASEKKTKKYKDLYEEEKHRHEEALQRYQEDHMNEMEIINLHKKCKKKARKVSQPKKALSKLDKLKKASPKSDEPKKTSRPGDGKKAATKAGKNVKKTSQPKKGPKSPEFIDPSEEKEGSPQDDKEKKIPSLLGVKGEAQSFFDLQGESKNLIIEKNVERVVFMVGPYEGYELSYVALCDTKYLKRVLKMPGLERTQRA